MEAVNWLGIVISIHHTPSARFCQSESASLPNEAPVSVRMRVSIGRSVRPVRRVVSSDLSCAGVSLRIRVELPAASRFV